MIRLKDVSKIYYNNGAVGTGFSNISTEFKIGEFVAIVGESGSGKSTLLNVISGLDTYEEGEMYIDGKETSHYTERDFEEYRRKYIANIFQAFNLVNSYTVRENVELVLLINGYKKQDVKARVDKIIRDVGLWELRNKKVTKLSGGQKQRVAIARALAKETPIIIADEPTGNLDSRSAKQIFKLLHDMSKDKLVIVVTHNLEQVSEYATRVIKMHDGKIIEDKKVKEVEEVKPELSFHKPMTFGNIYRLALKNTFNIFIRFAIILVVFIAVCITILGEVGSRNKQLYDDATRGASDIFIDASPKRIIINKDDKSEITLSDIEEIKKLSHVDDILTNDFMRDVGVIYSTAIYDTNISAIDIIDNFKGELEDGEMPKSDNEFLLVNNENSVDTIFYDDIINVNGKLNIENCGSAYSTLEGRIKGYAYDNSLSVDQNIMYVTENTYKRIQAYAFISNTEVSVKYLNGYIYEPETRFVELDNTIPRNTVYIPKASVKGCDETCLNAGVDLAIKSFYKTDNFKYDVKITEDRDDTIYIKINLDDVYDLINKDVYQLSVYADDLSNVDKLSEELDDLGYYVIAVKNTGLLDNPINKILEVINIVAIIFIISCLFFASYYVISLVLKSKVSYFTIVRMLGGNISLNKKLINLELFNSATIAFIITLIVVALNFNGVIDVQSLSLAIKYIKPIDYLLLYAIMILFSQMLSHKYTKKIFKDSMISTYNGEV